ncbi:MAG: redoxin domain-containing protein [Pseudomonadota bacterium]
MQLGELQNQLQRFNHRSASIIGISVDTPNDSLGMIKRLGLAFELASDPDQSVVKAFRVQNPDTQELALHAVYILSTEGRVVYRKVARRRPVSAELIDAIDAHLGTFPATDTAAPRQKTEVAFPTNDFQAILEIGKAGPLPDIVDPDAFAKVFSLLRSGQSDEAVFEYRRFLELQAIRSEKILMQTVRHLVNALFYADRPEVGEKGKELERRLNRVRTLEQTLETILEQTGGSASDEHDQALHTLAAARAGLTKVRAEISQNAQRWNLRSAKTTLRAYRELSLAYLRQ